MVMDRITQDLEGYRAAVSVLAVDELVAIGQAQIAAENAWQARLAGGFANRLLEAILTRQSADFASLLAPAELRLGRRSALPEQGRRSALPEQGPRSALPELRQGRRSALPTLANELEAATRAQAFLAADDVFRAIVRRSAGTDGQLPELDERSESVDIVIAYALKALSSALLAFRHRDCLSEADFAFLVAPYATVIGGRAAGAA
jgi:hypothetical protein